MYDGAYYDEAYYGSEEASVISGGDAENWDQHLRWCYRPRLLMFVT